MHNKMASMMTSSMQQGWSWKVEPASPPPLADLDTDNWFTIVNGEASLVANDCESSYIVPDAIEVVDEKPLTRAETATRLLNDLDEWIKEEPFTDWYEEKIDLPIFDELEPVPQMQVAASPIKDVTAYDNKEFIDICNYQGNVQCGMEAKVHVHNVPVVVSVPHQHHILANQHNHHMVPPQLIAQPVPMNGEQTSTLMQEFEYVLNNQATLTPPESPRCNDGMGLAMLQDMHTEELDELVRSRVESLVEGPDNSSCSSSLHDDSSADSPSSSDSGYDDPDWTPEPMDPEPKQVKRRRPTKPYGRAPPEEKRLRKKEQNKNAATRYRQKKKAEIEVILEEERDLQDTNAKLKTDLSELAREIKYLKNLMREVFKAKGLLK